MVKQEKLAVVSLMIAKRSHMLLDVDAVERLNNELRIEMSSAERGEI